MAYFVGATQTESCSSPFAVTEEHVTDLKMSKFFRDIMEQKYSHELLDGGKESWEDVAQARRLQRHEGGGRPEATVKEIETLIVAKKFMPGGRYLYAAADRSTRYRTACCFVPKTAARAGPTSCSRAPWR
jgi:hypothetical protein